MKSTKYLLKILPSFFLLVLFFSCSKDGGGSGADVFIPDLSQQWRNISTADNDTYNFNPDAVNVASSNFTGIENNNTTGDQNDLAGSFQNSKIEFTFTSGPKNGIKYSGTMSGTGINQKMTLTTPSGTIILQKQ